MANLFCKIFFILSLSVFAKADQYMYTIGGAGGKVNIFTDEFKKTIQAANNANWKSTVLFEGVNAQDFSQVQSVTSSHVGPFTQSEYAKMIQKISMDIDQKKITSKDKVLIFLDGHGAPINNAGPGHLVICEDGSCSTADLQPLLKKLEDHNIQTAFIDLSCYSGLSLNLHSSKTCVISAATDDDVAWTGFSKQFVKNLTPGKSLEQIFLESRRDVSSIGRPQISTPEGQYVRSQIEEIANEAPLDNTDVLDMAHRPVICDSAESRSQLTKNLHNLSSLSSKIYATAYYSTTQSYNKLSAQAKDLANQITELWNKKYTFDHFTMSMKGWLDTYESDAKGKEANFTNNIIRKSDDYKKMRHLQDEFKALTNTKGIVSTDNTYAGKSQLVNAGLRVEEAEKLLYDSLYRDEKSRTKESNACADFKF